MFRFRTKPISAHWAYGWTGAIVFILFGAASVALSLIKGNPFSPAEIAEAVGHVEQIENRKSGLHFKLREPNLLFVHHSGEIARVTSELSSATQPVTVKYRNLEPSQPLFREGSFFTVLSIRIGERSVLSENVVARHRSFESQLAMAVGAFFLLYGAFRTWRLRR